MPLSYSLRQVAARVLCLILIGSQTACMTAYKQSVGANAENTYSRLFLTDFNTAWQSVLDSLKKNNLDVSNRDAGFVQTRWTNNTAEKSFADSFGDQDSFLKAQYRVSISVAKAFYNGVPAIKVTVKKEQLVQRDVLEGWRTVDSDTIDENTLLYRIGRLISMRMKLVALEEEKTKKAIEETKF